MRIMVMAALLLWCGCALLMSEVRWFARPRLVVALVHGVHGVGVGVSLGGSVVGVWFR